MPGLEPGIQTLAFGVWMAGSSQAMTTGSRWVILFEIWYYTDHTTIETFVAPVQIRF
jgi:hypothetical protein